MASKPPLLMVTSYLDRVRQYPAAVVTASSAANGRDPWRVTDGRRESTWWEPTSDGGGSDNYLRVDLGAAGSGSADYAWLDRGHNLWGRTVAVESGATGSAWPDSTARAVPALDGSGNYVPGGNPESAWAVTEEGAAYTLFTATAARRWHQFRIPYVAGFVPRVTGLMVGARHQLGYSRISDRDASDRSVASERSTAGWGASDTPYAWRVLELDLPLINRADYDGYMRLLKRMLFDLGLPAVGVPNYGDYPAEGIFAKYEGTQFRAPTQHVLRSTRFVLTEYGPRAA